MMVLLGAGVAHHAVAHVAVAAVGGGCPHTEKSLWKEEDVSWWKLWRRLGCLMVEIMEEVKYD